MLLLIISFVFSVISLWLVFKLNDFLEVKKGILREVLGGGGVFFFVCVCVRVWHWRSDQVKQQTAAGNSGHWKSNQRWPTATRKQVILFITIINNFRRQLAVFPGHFFTVCEYFVVFVEWLCSAWERWEVKKKKGLTPFWKIYKPHLETSVNLSFMAGF